MCFFCRSVARKRRLGGAGTQHINQSVLVSVSSKQTNKSCLFLTNKHLSKRQTFALSHLPSKVITVWISDSSVALARHDPPRKATGLETLYGETWKGGQLSAMVGEEEEKKSSSPPSFSPSAAKTELTMKPNSTRDVPGGIVSMYDNLTGKGKGKVRSASVRSEKEWPVERTRSYCSPYRPVSCFRTCRTLSQIRPRSSTLSCPDCSRGRKL